MESKNAFFAWIGVVCAGLITAALCWSAATIISMKSDIAVLIARPNGVSREEYERDLARYDREIQQLRYKLFNDHS